MTNLNRTPGAFFFYLLVSFLTTLTMSMFFRSVASLSRSLVEAVTPSAVIILGLVLYTGYAIPITYMHGWSRWINYIDPVAYGFEALMINEFSGRTFECTNVVPSGPGYTNLANNQYSCSAVGGQPGSLTVNGEDYINLAYQYSHGHKWRYVRITTLHDQKKPYTDIHRCSQKCRYHYCIYALPHGCLPNRRRASLREEE